MDKVRAELPLPPKAVPVFSGRVRFRGMHGGRGSAKTQTMALMTAVKGYQYGRMGINGLLLCAREHAVNLDESSMQEVKDAIRRVPWLSAYYEIGEQFIRSKDRRINYAFTGLRHNIQGTKSKARILIAWVDEAEHVSEHAWRTLIPTVRAEGPDWNSEIWLSWNREFENSATNKRFIQQQTDEMKIIELNWRDNPWFPEVLNRQRLEDQRLRPETYGHIWEGEYLTLSDAQVFAGLFELSRFEPQPDWEGPYYGLDFGFSQDPTAATESYIFDNCLYIFRAAEKKKLEIDETASWLAKNFPRSTMHVIRADNARPESISYLKNHGVPRCIACKKGKGSVEDGVAYIKGFDRVYIHEDYALPAHFEFIRYAYKVDRLSGDIMPILVDAYNHIIDSLRYGLEPMIRSKGLPRLRAL